MFDVIMFTMSTWMEWKRGATNRNREVFRELRDHPDIRNIFLIDYLPHTPQRAARYALREFPYYYRRLNQHKRVDRSLYTISDNLHLYSTTLTALGPVGQREAYRRIARMQRKLSFEHTIIWSYTPLFTDYFRHIPAAVKVFDCVDNWAEHSSYRLHRRRLFRNYQTIEKQSDVIFTVSSELLKLFPDHKNAHFIPNGVRPFETVDIQSPQPLADRRIRIGYVGVIQDRVNAAILQAIAADKGLELHMFGPVWKTFDLSPFEGKDNVHFTNATLPHHQIPEATKDMDVMIIPHKVNQFTKSMNPMKLYDYLACGKPVVSTPLQDLGNLSRFVLIAQRAEQFPKLIKQAAKEDSLERRHLRLQTTASHSWKNKVEDMLSIIRSEHMSHEQGE
jgi:teichuronic acid biosynthesis glycosyltransferase TuaH